MQDVVILYPAFALVGWTFIMAAIMLRSAFKAVAQGLDRRYFRHGRGFEPPGYMLSAYQHYTNLFEMPVLFYTAVVMAYAAAVVNPLVLSLAWAYVGARVVHSLLHLKNTNVPRRRDSFLLSVGVLMVLWGVLLANVILK